MPRPSCHLLLAAAPPLEQRLAVLVAVRRDGRRNPLSRSGRTASSPDRPAVPEASRLERVSPVAASGHEAAPTNGCRTRRWPWFIRDRSRRCDSPLASVQLRVQGVDRAPRRVGAGVDAADAGRVEELAHVPLDRRLAVAEHVPGHAPARREVVVVDAVRLRRAVALLTGVRAAFCTGIHGSLRRRRRSGRSRSSRGRSEARRSA